MQTQNAVDPLSAITYKSFQRGHLQTVKVACTTRARFWQLYLVSLYIGYLQSGVALDKVDIRCVRAKFVDSVPSSSPS